MERLSGQLHIWSSDPGPLALSSLDLTFLLIPDLYFQLLTGHFPLEEPEAAHTQHV